jgi:pimeloyl-ACP methyl ester carboxylesterase
MHLIFQGHGSDTTNGDFSIERFANDTLDFLDQHQIDSVNIFGYSMGGYVALKLQKNIL